MATSGRVVTTATFYTAAAVLVVFENVVLVMLDRLGREEMTKFMAAGMLISPLLDCVEHVALNLDLITAGGGMVECAQNIVHDFINGD